MINLKNYKRKKAKKPKVGFLVDLHTMKTKISILNTIEKLSELWHQYPTNKI
jgi:hypothetical protein